MSIQNEQIKFLRNLKNKNYKRKFYFKKEIIYQRRKINKLEKECEEYQITINEFTNNKNELKEIDNEIEIDTSVYFQLPNEWSFFIIKLNAELDEVFKQPTEINSFKIEKTNENLFKISSDTMYLKDKFDLLIKYDDIKNIKMQFFLKLFKNFSFINVYRSCNEKITEFRYFK